MKALLKLLNKIVEYFKPQDEKEAAFRANFYPMANDWES